MNFDCIRQEVSPLQFGSTAFLFVFLPAFLAVYYLCPEKMRNALLFLGGIAFYAAKGRFMHSIWHLFVLLGSILHYLCVVIYVLP